MGIPGLITARHEKEIIALTNALKDNPEALAKNVFIIAVFTAGRVLGAAQTLEVVGQSK